MDRAAASLPPRRRVIAAAAVLALHLLIVAALIRALAPGLSQGLPPELAAALTVTVTAHPPPPPPVPQVPRAAPQRPAKAGQPGRRATPRSVIAPPVPIVFSPLVAPLIAASGSADTAGASSAGTGIGAGGVGDGTGSGGSMSAIKLSGDINAARDFPASSRDKRLGHFVVIMLTVGTDGHVHGCRIVTPSPDPAADQIVCRLANDRFRFRPARDRNGHPVESLFGWKQRWYRPGET